MRQGQALLVVFDGLGFSRTRSAKVADEAYAALSGSLREHLHAAVSEQTPGDQPAPGSRELSELGKLALYPVHAEALATETPVETARSLLDRLAAIRARLSPEDRAAIGAHIQQAALAQHYVPWAAESPALDNARNANLSFPTHASGKWVGFEDLRPEVMGNSDTGHQQIGNLWVAPQTALEISESIASGAFFENRVLVDTVTQALASGHLNFCFLLSGVGGSDGRVHSCWNHLEAFLELVFARVGLSPNQVRMEAILDGRDSPGDSAITRHGDIGDYLGRLQALLGRYGAVESLAWVVGRGIAMDRDYREANCKAGYLLLTQALGDKVNGFGGVREAVAAAHATGITDHDMPPMVVVHGNGGDGRADSDAPARTIRAGDAFVNLNFRADRQRATTASLIGHREFLRNESSTRDRPWAMEWLEDGLDIRYCGLADYHPDLAASGMEAAFATLPQPGNFLGLFSDLFPDDTYSLIGESTKSAHVGYFIRGRREDPPDERSERRTIVPSAGEESGIRSDTDFFKTPAMKAPEIVDLVSARLRDGRDRLIVCNFSNCDMLGHLLPARFSEAVAAYEALDQAVGGLLLEASECGYDVILTSDHGNVEEDGPAHSANEILTTIIPASQEIAAGRLGAYQARLFDIPWTLGTLLAVEERLSELATRINPLPIASEMTGNTLIRICAAQDGTGSVATVGDLHPLGTEPNVAPGK